MDGLTQQSKYSVTVTALFDQAPSAISEYEGVASKPATKPFTTTKLPACDWYLDEDDENTGIWIYVKNWDNRIDEYNFVSGNIYTLVASADNPGAQYAGTDTLTWTSSNSKVATVKANAGSYFATLNAVKNGWTKIEVSSKLTKKVIARYWVYVSTVGDAYTIPQSDEGKRDPEDPWYYGENEDLRTWSYSD